MLPTANRLQWRERRILINTCYGHFLSHLNMLVFPAVVLPLTDIFGMQMAGVLALSFWMYLFFGLTALPWGLAADRWGAGPLMGIYYVGAGLAAIAAAVFLDQPSIFVLALALMGLFSGIYHPTGLGLISKQMSRVSLAMGTNGMFGNLGIAAAPLLAGFINWLWGPKAVYGILGGLNLAGLLLMWIFPLREHSAATKTSSAGDNGQPSAFLILLVAMMLGGIVYRGATVILPAYFELKGPGIFNWLQAAGGRELSPNLVATGLVSLIYLIGMLGQYAGGHIADRYSTRYSYLVFHAITVPAAVGLSLTGDVPMVIAATTYAFFLLGAQPIENTLVASFTPKKFHHSAFGLKFVLTFGVGSLAVKLVAALQSRAGIESVFSGLGMISLLLVLVVVVLIRKTSPLGKKGELVVTSAG
jgi:MFS family permease